MEDTKIITSDLKKDETGLDHILGFSFSLLSGHGFNLTGFRAVPCFQKIKVNRSLFQTLEMPVLREHVHRTFDLCGTLFFRFRDVVADVGNLGNRVLSYYNHG